MNQRPTSALTIWNAYSVKVAKNLKKAAVDITRELILLRIALHDDIDIWQHVSTDEERTTVEQNLAAKVVKDINESLGDYDD